MKVKFKFGIETYSGKLDEMVYGSFRNHKLCIGREFVYPRLTDNNHIKGDIAKNLAKVYKEADPDYIADLKTYCQRHGSQNVPKTQLIPTAFAMFMKMMYAWYDSDPEHVDLKSVTIGDIITLEAEVRSIAEAVEAEFLPAISNYEDLTSLIQ